MKNILENETYHNDLKAVLGNVELSQLKGSSIMVTGGLGLIGSAIVDLLILYNTAEHAELKIFVADINESFYESRYGKYDFVSYVKYDALKPFNVDFKLDYIIHGAGLSSPELYVKMPVETILSNFNGVLNLLMYSKDNGVKRLLYISSSEVYGKKDSKEPFIENVFGSADINNVRASYYEAKRASEVLCRSFSSEYGVETVIVRPGHIYGPTASPRDKRISSEFAYLAAQGKDLEMNSTGLQKRSYCYSIDCASAILTVLLKGQVGESYNIGHDEVTSIRKMAEILADEGNVELKVKEPTEAELKHFNPMDNSSLNNEKVKGLGYRDTFSVLEGLRHTVKILKDLQSD